MVRIKRSPANAPSRIRVTQDAVKATPAKIKRAPTNPRPKRVKLHVAPGAPVPVRKWITPPKFGVLPEPSQWAGAEEGALMVAKVDLYARMDRSKHFDGDYVLTTSDYDPGRMVQLSIMVKAGTYGMFLERVTVEVATKDPLKKRLVTISRFHIEGKFCTVSEPNVFELVGKGEGK